jgi:hypothetical protein
MALVGSRQAIQEPAMAPAVLGAQVVPALDRGQTVEQTVAPTSHRGFPGAPGLLEHGVDGGPSEQILPCLVEASVELRPGHAEGSQFGCVLTPSAIREAWSGNPQRCT